jgi:L-ribulose-5-phosphate 3-epimerase UlaE
MSEEDAMDKLLKLATELGFDRSEFKIYKKDDEVVRVSFWSSKHASIEAALAPEEYEIFSTSKEL